MLHHPDDEKWIVSQLLKLKPELREKAVKGYEKVFLAAFNNATKNIEREGNARREANTRLRNYVNSVLAKDK